MPSPSGCLVEFLYLISDRGNIVVEFSYQADRPYKDLKNPNMQTFQSYLHSQKDWRMPMVPDRGISTGK